MLKTGRQKEIMGILKTRGAAEIRELCRIFNVTEMTIRRDLDELVKNGARGILRTHGGAMLSEENVLLELPFNTRDMQNRPEKEAIARAALSIIEDGQRIMLDSGTTMFYLAKQLDNSKRLIVVTNAINIAIELNMRSNISVIPVGGMLQKNTFSCVGGFAETMIRQFRVDVSFIGVGGISEAGDLSNNSTEETGVKRAMIAAGKRKIVLADSSKIGKEKFSTFANLEDLDLLITDSNAPPKIVERFHKSGIKTRMVEA